MAFVSNILSTKSAVIYSITPDQTVYRGLEMMVEKNIGALLVMEGDTLQGIFSEREYARNVMLKGKSSRETNISDIMITDIIIVTPETSVDDCMRLMSSKFIRHLPVLKGEKVVGIISIGDVVKSVIEDQKFIIENMEHYIAGT